MTLTKNSLISKVSTELELPGVQSKIVVGSLVELLKSTLASGEDVLISGFGKFKVRHKGERNGRNPYTGASIKLRSRKVIVFGPSKVFRREINR